MRVLLSRPQQSWKPRLWPRRPKSVSGRWPTSRNSWRIVNGSPRTEVASGSITQAQCSMNGQNNIALTVTRLWIIMPWLKWPSPSRSTGRSLPASRYTLFPDWLLGAAATPAVRYQRRCLCGWQSGLAGPTPWAGNLGPAGPMSVSWSIRIGRNHRESRSGRDEVGSARSNLPGSAILPQPWSGSSSGNPKGARTIMVTKRTDYTA